MAGGVTRLEWIYNIVAIVSDALVVLSQLFLALTLIYKLHSSPPIAKAIRIPTMLFFSCLSIAYTMSIASKAAFLRDPESEAWRSFWVLYYIFSGFALMMIYAVMAVRLSKTFEGTTYAQSKRQKYIHACIAVVGMLLVVSVPIIGQHEPIEGLSFFVLMSAFIVLLLCMASLTYKWVRLLYQQVVNEAVADPRKTLSHFSGLPNICMAPSRSASVSAEDEPSPPASPSREPSVPVIVPLPQRLELLVTVRKHSLLGFIMFVTTLLATCTSWLSIFCGDDEMCTGIFWCVWYPWHAFNIVASGFCVFMAFTINRNVYQLFCRCCDKRCELLCQKSAHKTAERQRTLSMIDFQITDATAADSQ